MVTLQNTVFMDAESRASSVISFQDFQKPGNESIVTLQVGLEQYRTMRKTLTSESLFFTKLLSDPNAALPDGSYFVDADPDLFADILQYLRRGTFPIYFDVQKGHDLPRYIALLHEARHLKIHRLQEWLESRKYLAAVTVNHQFELRNDEGIDISRVVGPNDSVQELTTSNATVEYIPTWGVKKVYVCPRGIPVHMGNQDGCGMRCHKAQGNAPPVYDEVPTLRMLVLTKKVTVNTEHCSASH